MNKQVLLIIYSNLGLGGVQTKIVDIIKYIRKHYPDTNIHLLLLTKTVFDKSFQLRSTKIEIHNYAVNRPFMNTPVLFALYVLWVTYTIKAEKILGFLSPFGLPAILAKIVLFWRKIVVVVSEDNYTSAIIHSLRYSKLNEIGIHILYRFANTIIVQTKAIKLDLIQTYNLSAKNIQIVPNWTSLPPANKKQTKKICDIIYAGRLDRTKNVITILHAVNQLKRWHKNILLHIYGEGSEKGALESYVKFHRLEKNIVFFPPTLEIKSKLKQSKIFVLTSRQKAEGFPITLLEAMSVGTPVVSSDFSGAREILLANSNGYIYKTTNDFVRYCDEILNKNTNVAQVISNAKNTVRTSCSPDNIKMYADSLTLTTSQ